ncbi:hypothetical protein [Streptomyces cadmiisoli]|uniref:hypothetical protein n=1 Tax=Streptomyces cadmiisoli TaxID=2184053 RepID=UPI003658031A
MPGIRAALLGTGIIEVLPAEPADTPQQPFAEGDDGWWTLADDAPLLTPLAAHDVSPPSPGLVTIGHTEAGDLFLINLLQQPALLLDGRKDDITAFLTSLAVELGMSPWAPEADITTIGFGDDLPRLLPRAAITHQPDAATALRTLTDHLLQAHQHPGLRQRPQLLLCADPLDTDSTTHITTLLDTPRPHTLTLVCPTTRHMTKLLPQAPLLDAAAPGPQPVPETGRTATLQHLHPTDLTNITQPTDHQEQETPRPHQAKKVRSKPPPPDHRLGASAAVQTGTGPAGGSAQTPEPGTNTPDNSVFPALLAATSTPGPKHPPAPHPASVSADHRTAPAASPRNAASASPLARHTHTTGSPEDGPDISLSPKIRVLGPIEVDNVPTTGHGPRVAQLAALLCFRPHHTADALCHAMDPAAPWTTSTLNARIQELRRALGKAPDGTPYVPRRRHGDDPYRLHPAIHSDWGRFQHLTDQYLPNESASLPALEDALALVRGRPFGHKPPAWAEPFQQDITTKIVEVAHTVAAHRTTEGPHHNLSQARQAVATGLDADDTAEVLYRDWLHIEHTAGNRRGVHTAISRLQQISRHLDTPLEPETQQLIHALLAPAPTPPHQA